REQACDVAIINNPHNPSGTLIPASALREAQFGALIIDEAFIDYAPSEAITAEAATRPGVIAIRSLTKFYGCPALRVGYAIAEPRLARGIAACSASWPVTTLALNAAAEALLDEDYARETLAANAGAREELSGAMRGLGLRVFPSAANYLLL